MALVLCNELIISLLRSSYLKIGDQIITSGCQATIVVDVRLAEDHFQCAAN